MIRTVFQRTLIRTTMIRMNSVNNMSCNVAIWFVNSLIWFSTLVTAICDKWCLMHRSGASAQWWLVAFGVAMLIGNGMPLLARNCNVGLTGLGSVWDKLYSDGLAAGCWGEDATWRWGVSTSTRLAKLNSWISSCCCLIFSINFCIWDCISLNILSPLSCAWWMTSKAPVLTLIVDSLASRASPWAWLICWLASAWMLSTNETA